MAILTVHPRARGEHKNAHSRPVFWFGSSPRTRGTLQTLHRVLRFVRFIPAHAGNTARRRVKSIALSVHPRARGEHRWGGCNCVARRGSSPRTRGTPRPKPQPSKTSRFIPAHAGNTPASANCIISSPVHPRARGEHRSSQPAVFADVGSSPRTRGTQVFCGTGRLRPRFIPAHAGNTSVEPSSRATDAVHPRARGEHELRFRTVLRVVGSSPRTRGTHFFLQNHKRLSRFIPAHAGNTWPGRAISPRPAVHPRARGEHEFAS